MAHFLVEDLTFTYPDAPQPALIDVNLEIAQGAFLCLCGKSGCGKTTLLRQLKSPLAPHGQRSGRVLIDGVPLEKMSEREQAASIGFVMQDPDAQIVTDKVWHELAFGLENLGVAQESMHLRVAEMASFFGIEEWFHKDVSDLSGGQKQLLNLASVMAMQPAAIILDEPTGQLDPIATTDLLNAVHRVNRELGVTVIMAEHRLEEVYAMADRIVVMDAGRVVCDGSPREVAERLYAHNDPMTYALPAPIRIFHGVEGSTDGPGRVCPLTVREGREWLSSRIKDHPPSRIMLPEGLPPKVISDDVALEMNDVWFRYDRDGSDVLRGVDLRIAEGSLYGLLGGNGAGKTTVLRCACGLQRPYRGSLRVFGRKLKGRQDREAIGGEVALLPQDPRLLFSRRTVREDLQEMLSGQEQGSMSLDEVAETCDIERLLDAHPLDLSGGEQQRVALGKVLLTQPRLLLLDEPTKGIDGFYKRELAQLLGRLKAEGMTIVLASHDIEFCAQYADEAALLFDGRIAAAGTARSFFARNSFYTTAANRMSRGMFEGAVTDQDVIDLCLS